MGGAKTAPAQGRGYWIKMTLIRCHPVRHYNDMGVAILIVLPLINLFNEIKVGRKSVHDMDVGTNNALHKKPTCQKFPIFPAPVSTMAMPFCCARIDEEHHQVLSYLHRHNGHQQQKTASPLRLLIP